MVSREVRVVSRSIDTMRLRSDEAHVALCWMTRSLRSLMRVLASLRARTGHLPRRVGAGSPGGPCGVEVFRPDEVARRRVTCLAVLYDSLATLAHARTRFAPCAHEAHVALCWMTRSLRSLMRVLASLRART